MSELVAAIFEQLEEHWIKFATAAAFMAVGWFFGKRRERRNWEKREFLDRLNVSLNTIQDGKLQIRTILEKPNEEVFLNKTAVAQLLQYSGETEPSQPIIPIPEHDRWYYLNAVLNEISEKFALGPLMVDNQMPVIRQQYIICLTNEVDGSVKTRKIRAMMIQKQVLFNLPDEMPQLERENHQTRWNTLQTIAAKCLQDASYFMELEVAIPDQTAHNKSIKELRNEMTLNSQPEPVPPELPGSQTASFNE